jgi:hypothetical protein
MPIYQGYFARGAAPGAGWEAVGKSGPHSQGQKPADLPVQGATKIELTVNLKTAKALSFEMPTSMLLRADEVIE